jgi:hypothetical protein
MLGWNRRKVMKRKQQKTTTTKENKRKTRWIHIASDLRLFFYFSLKIHCNVCTILCIYIFPQIWEHDSFCIVCGRQRTKANKHAWKDSDGKIDTVIV